MWGGCGVRRDNRSGGRRWECRAWLQGTGRGRAIPPGKWEGAEGRLEGKCLLPWA